MANFAIRKLADKGPERVKLFDPLTGEAALYTPEDAEALLPLLQAAQAEAAVSPTPRPLLGISIEGKPPKKAKLPTGFVANGISEGWIEAEGEGELVVRSSARPRTPSARRRTPSSTTTPWSSRPWTATCATRWSRTPTSGLRRRTARRASAARSATATR